ncbi:MAG: PD40 domain-containing protein [Holophagaceae bacterium]|nr:PD40 domain-containing protein [Holophagaceae bacterium]
MEPIRAFAPVALVLLLACKSGGSDAPGGGSPSGPATVPGGQVAFDSDRTGNYEIYLMAADGSSVRPLTSDARYDTWWPRISPDRTRILFYRTAKGLHDSDYTKTSLWLMNADGSGQVQAIANGANGWQFQGHGEWSPDGTRIVMFGGSAPNLNIFVTNASGQSPVAITSRSGLNIDPSWSPDGATVAFISTPAGSVDAYDQEVYRVPANGGAVTRLTNDHLIDNDPYFAPDGQTIAFLTQTLPPGSPGKPLGTWGIRKIGPNGTGLGTVIDDGQINSKPDWSTDGSLIRFHRTLYFGSGTWSLFQIRPDGTGLLELTPGQSWNNEFPCAGGVKR